MVKAQRQIVDPKLRKLPSILPDYKSKIGNELLVTDRNVLHSGSVEKISTQTATRKEHHIYLFDDSILITKPKNNTQTCVISIPIQMALVLDTELQLPTFVVMQLDTLRLFHFACSTPTEKNEWIDKIEVATAARHNDEKRLAYNDVIIKYQSQSTKQFKGNSRFFGVPIPHLQKKATGLTLTERYIPPFIKEFCAYFEKNRKFPRYPTFLTNSWFVRNFWCFSSPRWWGWNPADQKPHQCGSNYQLWWLQHSFFDWHGDWIL